MVRLFAILFIAAMILAFQDAPYAGQQHRSIKSLSGEQIKGYLNGKGMGLAKAAELNHYPGPRHVLDLADKLGLSKDQIAQSEKLFQDMKTEAIAAGKQIIHAEKALDSLFANNVVTPETLEAQLQRIGRLKAKLRYVHLKYHLTQKALLTPEQIKLYDQLRGYGKDGHHHGMHHHSGH